MPIEVTAVIDRESAVYLAGEAIHCKVSRLTFNLGSQIRVDVSYCFIGNC